MNQKIKSRWGLYIAGLSVREIALREQAIQKNLEVLQLARRFVSCQGDLIDALRGEKVYSKELSATDSAFIELARRRGLLS